MRDGGGCRRCVLLRGGSRSRPRELAEGELGRTGVLGAGSAAGAGAGSAAGAGAGSALGVAWAPPPGFTVESGARRWALGRLRGGNFPWRRTFDRGCGIRSDSSWPGAIGVSWRRGEGSGVRFGPGLERRRMSHERLRTGAGLGARFETVGLVSPPIDLGVRDDPASQAESGCERPVHPSTLAPRRYAAVGSWFVPWS